MMNDQELYSELQNYGGFNQKFMANSVEEAGFLLSSEFDAELEEMEPSGTRKNTSTHDSLLEPQLLDDDWSIGTIKEKNCEKKCALLKSIMRNALKDQISAEDEKNFTNNDAPKGADSELNSGLDSSHTCKSDVFIKIGICSKNESKHEADGEFSTLCRGCKGIFVLPTKCFPRFLNAVQCPTVEESTGLPTCIHETWSNNAHGKCISRSTNFIVMRNVGSRKCQSWVTETIRLNTSCECLLNNMSWLRV